MLSLQIDTWCFLVCFHSVVYCAVAGQIQMRFAPTVDIVVYKWLISFTSDAAVSALLDQAVGLIT